MEAHLKANAEMTIQQLRPLSGMDFGYNRASVEWLEGYIERLRQSGQLASADLKDRLTGVFGSFLGECIVRCHGGAWEQRNDGWCVAFDPKNAAFPFAKVRKQLDHGAEDGIGGFFRAIPVVFASHVGGPRRGAGRDENSDSPLAATPPATDPEE
jgi:hypothetical protein